MSHDHPVKQGRNCYAMINRLKLMSGIFTFCSYQSEDCQDASSMYLYYILVLCTCTIGSLVPSPSPKEEGLEMRLITQLAAKVVITTTWSL